jgi:hypothetical protein
MKQKTCYWCHRPIIWNAAFEYWKHNDGTFNCKMPGHLWRVATDKAPRT